MNHNEDIHNSTIMVVDDDPLSLMIIEETLHEAGYKRCITCDDPRQAIALSVEEDPDLVLLDINMPHLSGYDLLTLFLEPEAYRFLPIIVLTSQSDEEARLKALDLGALDFITKPFEKLEMLTRIRNMLTVRSLQKRVENHNRSLEEKVRERTQELAATQQEIIRRLSQAAEYRDDDTGTHIERMSLMCEALARTIGMNDREVDLVLNAAPMHDVGKIGIPDAILLKPGKFTPEERKAMEKHTTIGGKILEGNDSPLMAMAREIALTHHERWDGKGYPFGIVGEEIPLPGRIASLCDVYDALTSVRPYKKAWTNEDALDLIRKCNGENFDPTLVEAFLDITPIIVDIKERFDGAGGNGRFQPDQ